MSSSLHPLGVKNGEWTCSGLHYSTCHCMPLIHFPRSRTQISANHLSGLACRDATSSEHQSSSLHSRFVFTVLDYRCQQEACTAKGTTKPGDIWHALHYASSLGTFFSTAAWHKDGFEISCRPCMHFLFEHMHAHYCNISSHIRLCRSPGSTPAAFVLPTGNFSDR